MCEREPVNLSDKSIFVKVKLKLREPCLDVINIGHLACVDCHKNKFARHQTSIHCANMRPTRQWQIQSVSAGYVNRDRFDEVCVWHGSQLELKSLSRGKTYFIAWERDMAKIIKQQEQEWRQYKWNLKWVDRLRLARKSASYSMTALSRVIFGPPTSCQNLYNGRCPCDLRLVTQRRDLTKHARPSGRRLCRPELTKVNIKTLHDNYFGVFDTDAPLTSSPKTIRCWCLPRI